MPTELPYYFSAEILNKLFGESHFHSVMPSESEGVTAATIELCIGGTMQHDLLLPGLVKNRQRREERKW